MKKIKLVTTLSSLGVLSSITPIVTTSCTNDVKLKIELDTNEVIIGTQGFLYASLLDESSKVLNIKRVASATSSDEDILTVKGLSLLDNTIGLIRVRGKKEGNVTLSISIIDENDKITKSDFTIDVSKDKSKNASIKNIKWIDENESEVQNPVFGGTYVFSDATITCEGKQLDFELLRSIVDNGSDEELGVVEIVEPETGLITISITPTTLGRKNLKLKFEFYNDDTQTESTIYNIETSVDVVGNYITATVGPLDTIYESGSSAYVTSYQYLVGTDIVPTLAFTPEGATVTWSLSKPEGTYWSGDYIINENTGVVIVDYEPYTPDTLIITAKNGEEQLAEFTLNVQSYGDPLEFTTVTPSGGSWEYNNYEAYWSFTPAMISGTDATLTFSGLTGGKWKAVTTTQFGTNDEEMFRELEPDYGPAGSIIENVKFNDGVFSVKADTANLNNNFFSFAYFTPAQYYLVMFAVLISD